MRRVTMTTVVVTGLTIALTAACGGSESSSAAADAGEGAAVYAAACASCPAIRDGAPQHHWDFGPMPPVEGLDDDEIDAVIEFIRAEQDRRGFQR